MKSSRLALMVWACTAASAAFAQGALPQCETSNWDQARGVFTVMNPGPGIVQQECLLTIHPAQAAGAQFPAPFLVEGYYDVVMSGGGGGGGGGGDSGGGGGGAGATPFKTIKLLLPGMYKLTLGAGGDGGRPGGFAQAGSPTSLTDANTGQHIAGFEGADHWRASYQSPGSGRGGIAAWGGSNGGDGAKFNPTVLAEAQSGSPLQAADYSGTPGRAGGVIDRSVRTAQPGGMLQISGYAGSPGPAGGEPIRTARANDGRIVEAFAGGGGGAGFGDGGVGQPADGRMPAGMGELGGGGGGGRGGENLADAGGSGGHGFIQLSMSEPYVVAAAVAPPVVTTPEPAATPEPTVTPRATPAEPPASRPARRDRN
ncbi:MAG: hypothetical protein HYS65_15295 [Betaproteobacteria bacterium]|nr:hypothetical protein [Betaproteobacteria bacterium]MBI2288965.1 hypothetical protein [Betaproteobacteria bacterium]MBI3056993.1 hypothetical protein [Betaproteobacteria bacterium]